MIIPSMAPCESVEERGYSNVPPTLMKTIIFDIDGTITNMWPIEKSVLLSLLGKDKNTKIEKLYRSGIKDTYMIFHNVSNKKIGKVRYRKIYSKIFSLLAKNKKLAKLEKYPLVNFIQKNKNNYRFIYVTGGQKKETEYVLNCLKLKSIFDLKNSINTDNYSFSKVTGLPFKKIKAKFPDCLLVSDSEKDCGGATKAKISYIKVMPNQNLSKFITKLEKRNLIIST